MRLMNLIILVNPLRFKIEVDNNFSSKNFLMMFIVMRLTNDNAWFFADIVGLTMQSRITGIAL